MARLSAAALRLLTEELGVTWDTGLPKLVKGKAAEPPAAFGSMAPAPEEITDIGPTTFGIRSRAPVTADFAMYTPSAPAIRRGQPSYLTDEGIPDVSKMGDYARASKDVQASMAAEPKGVGPMDLSSAGQIPDVPQVPLERYEPPRGVSPRMLAAIEDPKVIGGIDSSIQEGLGYGADKWYHTEPIRRAYVAQLGPEKGQEAFRHYMTLVAATSPRSDVPTNIRNASFYNTLLRSGESLPDKNPYPYGHIAQALHKGNIEGLSRDRSLSAAGTNSFGFDIFQNPKPASFVENLAGNLEPGTMDTHAFRNIGMSSQDPRFLTTWVSEMAKTDQPGAETLQARFGEFKPKRDQFVVTYRPQKLLQEGRLTLDEALKIPAFWAGKPKPNEYAAAEQLYKQRGAKVGLPTADAQAASWAGAGKLTGLGTVPDKTFPEMLNERVEYTARMRNEDPQKTLKDFIAGKKPLLSVTGLMALTGAEVAKHDGAPAGGAV